GEQGRQEMALEMVDPDGRLAQREGRGGPEGGAHQQRAGQARPGGIGDRVDRVEGDARGLADLAHEARQAPDVVARGELRDHAAVALVHRHLGMQRLAEQAGAGVVEGDAGLVAGSLDAEYTHGPILVERPPALAKHGQTQYNRGFCEWECRCRLYESRKTSLSMWPCAASSAPSRRPA